jgi:hypothetical protein
MYISNAEADICDFFGTLDIGLDYKNDDELVVIKPKLMKSVERQYKQLSNAYAGHMTEMIKQVEDLKKELVLQNERHEKELKEKELELKNKDIELLKKDLELANLRNKLLTQKDNM